MWTTVLLLAIAVNLEPTRFIMVPLLLARERPMLQLLAYLIGCVTINLAFGFLILFVFHRNPLGSSASGGAKAQIVVGGLVLLVASVLVINWLRTKDRAPAGRPGLPATPARPHRIDKFADNVRRFLRRGRSPLWAGLLGASVGIPSVDYLAVLLIIGTSGRPAPEQAAALGVFVVVGNLVVMAPLIGYLISPSTTLQRLDRFAQWTRTRSQVEYAGLLALVGAVLIGVGYSHL